MTIYFVIIVLKRCWRVACVWDVAFTASGDLASGCADYVARLWTPDAARAAPAGAQQVSHVLKSDTSQHTCEDCACNACGSAQAQCQIRCAVQLLTPEVLSYTLYLTRLPQYLRQAAAAASNSSSGGGGGAAAGALPQEPKLVDLLKSTGAAVGPGCEVLCGVVQEYEERIAARAAAVAGSTADGGGDGVEAAGALPQGLKLEDASVLAEPGKRSGQIVVVRENGAGVAYSWDADRWASRAHAL